MQRLYLLGFTQDLKGIVFTERKGGRTATFWVPVDETLLSAIEKLGGARSDRSMRKTGGEKALAPPPIEEKSERVLLPAVGRSESSSKISVSEIQQLLRMGRTIETVTKAAKAPRAWIERLSEPVNTEREGVIRLAQRSYMPRSRLGPSGLPLGQAIRQNLEERRATVETIEAIDDGWDARALRAGPWRIRLRFTHRGSRRVAEWDYVKSSGQITSRNRLAAELGWWPPPPEPKRAKGAEEDGEEAAEDAAAAAQRKRAPVRRQTRR